MGLLSGRRVMVLDTETTGFDPADGHELVEVASVMVENQAIAEEWSSLIRPARPIPPGATAVHGITDAMTASAPEAASVAAQLRARCADLALAFHNAEFDLPFLRALLRGAGQPPLVAPVVDTLGLARGLFGSGGNSLAPLARRLGLAPESAHRALADARTSARVLIELAKRWETERGVKSFDELAAISQDQVRLTRRSRPGGAPLRSTADAATAPGSV
ncbi:MAG: 3'-5' exonuclease [Candidatus Eiseniibacteriota bacterium]